MQALIERKKILIDGVVDFLSTVVHLWTIPILDFDLCLGDRGRFRGAVCDLKNDDLDALDENVHQAIAWKIGFVAVLNRRRCRLLHER